MRTKANLTSIQREIIKALKEYDSIIICPADKGKGVVIEDRDVYLIKPHHQISEGDYTLTTKSKKAVLRRLHRKLMDRLISMGITDFKEQRMYT